MRANYTIDIQHDTEAPISERWLVRVCGLPGYQHAIRGATLGGTLGRVAEQIWAHSPCADGGDSSSQPSPPSTSDAAPPHASGESPSGPAPGRGAAPSWGTDTARANSGGGTRDHARAQSLPGHEVRNPEGQGAAPLWGPSCWHCGGTGHLGIHCPQRPAWPLPDVVRDGIGATLVQRVRRLRGGR